jgi:hypothetical protein
MRLEDLPDDFTPEQFMQLDREGLDQVPYEVKKWICQAKGCKNGTKVRDYGILPWIWLHRNSKYSHRVPHAYWCDTSNRFNMCGKHSKMFRHLEKIYGFSASYDKLMQPFYGEKALEPIKEMEIIKQIENIR